MWGGNNSYLEAIQVIAIEDIVKQYTCINLFIGFYLNDLTDIVDKKVDILRDNGLSINKVYMFDSSFAAIPNRGFDYYFIYDNKEQLEWLYHKLADQNSKDVLTAFINQRISMLIGWLDNVRDRETKYFPKDIVKLNNNGVYVDCGAYVGDTVKNYIDTITVRGFSKYDRIYAIEPDRSNFNKLSLNCSQIDSIQLVNQGVWSKVGKLCFAGNNNSSSRIVEEGSDVVNVTTIDHILNGKKPTLIKMDVEGSELEALKGTHNTLIEHSPQLAISVYHKKQDLLDIPRYINSIEPNYKFYLRAYESQSLEVVLYCVKR